MLSPTPQRNLFRKRPPMSAKTFTAKDVLLYLFSDCASWTENVDGDARDDGTPYTIVHHDIRVSDAHLSELMDMAGIPPGSPGAGRIARPLFFLVDRVDSTLGVLVSLMLAVPVPPATGVYVLLVGVALHGALSIVTFQLGGKARAA